MKRPNPRIIGLFVLSAAALAFVGVLLFGSGQLFSKRHAFVSYFDANVSGLSNGSPVKFRGVQVGSVDDVLLNLRGDAADSASISIPVQFHIDEDRIRSRGVSLDIGDSAVVDSMIDAGLRATLAVESIVTGIIYIELNMFPDRAAVFRAERPGRVEIPTVQTGLEELQNELYSIVRKVAAVDLDTLVVTAVNVIEGVEALVGTEDVGRAVTTLTGTVAVLDSTFAELRSLVANMDSTLVPVRSSLLETADRFRLSAEELDETLLGFRSTLEPESPVAFQLETALRDLAAAARSFRDLADYLERNPSALIRGRPNREDDPDGP